MSSNRRNYIWQLLTVYLGFILFGLSENIKGPAIPRMQLSFNLNEAQIGMLLSLNSLGYLIACTFTAILVRKIGIKATSVISFVSMLLSGILIWFSYNYTWLIGSTFLLYIGNGMLEIGLAILAARIFTKNTGTMMNLAHFFYGLSSIVAPLLATGLMSISIMGVTVDWGLMYMIVLGFSLIPIIPTLLGKFPGNEIKQEDRKPLLALARDRSLWLLVGILTFGVVAELSVGGWLVNYLEKSYQWSSVSAASMLSSFFIGFSLARLLLGPIIDRIGYTLSIIIVSLFAALCTFAAVLGGEGWAIFFALAGAGVAPIYPTVMAFISKRYPNDSDVVITFIVTIMGLGTVVGNYVIGLIVNGVKYMYGGESQLAIMRGYQAGYLFIGVCALLCSVLAAIMYMNLKKKNELI
ncbi:MFS transporter [Paenibacillus septentrionalis]|uniref:MFS transporter n=1 Tax=Paenibacillus septentrionalis TaxID=429342 RepID=A0ABW1V2W3_9BACL